jgi:hypothetical protein
MKKANTPVDQSVAKNEIQQWLDFKQIDDIKKETQKDSIEKLESSIVDGSLTFDPETHELTQNLKFAVGSIDKLTYKPRLTRGDLAARTKGVAINDLEGRIDAYICALTNNTVNVIKQMDTEDFGIAQSIAGFFF